ncbi:hypothetical protein D3C87_1435680 [compost metagenome]
MMNDYHETKYGYGVFEEAATEILNDAELREKFPSLTTDFFDEVDKVISPMQLSLHPVIACFSKRADLLSQWVRYGDNGRGFCVGFSAEKLVDMPVTVLEVEYDRLKQLSEMKIALISLFIRDSVRGENYGSDFRQECAVLAAFLYAFKASGFQEEQEVRIIHLLDVITDGDMPRLKDAGGEVKGKTVKGQIVKYRVSDGAFVAYIDLPFHRSHSATSIKEIWFGPKNGNGPGNVIYLAGNHGYKGYSLMESKVTYR